MSSLQRVGEGLQDEHVTAIPAVCRLERGQPYQFHEIGQALEHEAQFDKGRVVFTEQSNLTRLAWLQDGHKITFSDQHGNPRVVVEKKDDSYIIVDVFGVPGVDIESLHVKFLESTNGEPIGLHYHLDGQIKMIGEQAASVLAQYVLEEKINK